MVLVVKPRTCSIKPRNIPASCLIDHMIEFWRKPLVPIPRSSGGLRDHTCPQASDSPGKTDLPHMDIRYRVPNSKLPIYVKCLGELRRSEHLYADPVALFYTE